jgi:hypothetical protein
VERYVGAACRLLLVDCPKRTEVKPLSNATIRPIRDDRVHHETTAAGPGEQEVRGIADVLPCVGTFLDALGVQSVDLISEELCRGVAGVR